MSSPYPPQPPKKLLRSKSNRMLGGVCGGLASYLNMDPTLVRVLTVIVSLFTGVPVVLYIVALFVVPEEGSPETGPSYPPVNGPGAPAAWTPPAPPAYAPAEPPAPPAPAAAPWAPSPSVDDSVWGTEGAPWEQRQPAGSAPGEEVPAAGAAHEADLDAPQQPKTTEDEQPAPDESGTPDDAPHGDSEPEQKAP